METHKILVIIPAYNCDFILSKSIESVLSQTYKNFVLCIIDDASEDKTYEIMQRYAQKDSRVVIDKMEKNRGSFYCRNLVLKKHIQKFDCWVTHGADDVMHPTKLEEQLNSLREGYLATTCNYERRDIKTSELLNTMMMRDCILYSKKVFDTVGLYDWETRFGGDSEYLERFYSQFGESSLNKLDKILYTAYTHGNNLTLTVSFAERKQYAERYRERIKHTNPIKHIIFIRMNFADKELFKKYLQVSKEVLVPALKSQVNKNFELCVLIRQEDVEFVKNFLQLNFTAFSSVIDYVEYVTKNNVHIQTRHDMDDFMSDTYVEKIQQTYKENINKWDSFLIQSQPVKLLYDTKEEVKMGLYTEKRNSMFLSICQRKTANHILERKHGQMHEITSNVISLPVGYTKWVIHEDNISIKKGLVK